MLSVDQIKSRLKDSNLKRVAIASGVDKGVVYRFMAGKTEPLYKTVKALSDYLQAASV
jgi:predicted transcriptional regulator